MMSIILACGLHEIVIICFFTSHAFKQQFCFEDHRSLQRYNGGLWKTFACLGYKEDYQYCFVGYIVCYVCDPLYVFDTLL